MVDQAQVIQLVIAELPGVISGIKELFAKQNPDVPQPTSEEVINAFRLAFEQSLRKDQDWLATHPEVP